MLSEINIKNFKSIESISLDLSFVGTAPNGYKESNIISFLEPTSKIEDRFVSIMNIYGANASGKSNIIHSLFCFNKVLSGGIKNIPFDIFAINKLKNTSTETSIELVFFIKKTKYKYLLEYNGISITKEILYLNDKELFSIKETKGNFKGIEIKNFDNSNLKNRFEVSCISNTDNKKRQVNTFLSSIILDLPSLNKDLNLVYKFLTESIVISLNNDIPGDFSINQLAKSNDKKDIEKAFNRISDFIKKLDIDIEKFKYEQKEENLDKYLINKNEYKIPNTQNKSIYINKDNNIIRINEIKSIHKDEKGNDISFGLHEESTGTKLTFGLIGTILKILDKGGVFIIDELDRSLHTLLLQSLMRVFKDKDYNKNNAQLICTLHNTDILDNNLYKISEFSFINKNLKKGSFLKRLSDFPDIRNDLNFRGRYLDGFYSGIPYPYD